MEHFKPTLIIFPRCPDFATINVLKHEYFIITAGAYEGCYAIVIELAPNGKVNNDFKL